MTIVSIAGPTDPATDLPQGLLTVDANTETYLGETYRLERREIATFTNNRGYRVVWCWEVLTGPAKGEFGGKQNLKSEARKWAKHAIREIGPERLRDAAALAATQTQEN